MFEKKQLCYNGKYISGESYKFFSENRAFLYGDSIFETIFVSKGKIHFFDEHTERLIRGMKILKYEIPDKFTIFKNKLEDEIFSLIAKNKLYKSARVRLTVFRSSGGLYTPNSNAVDYILTVSDPGHVFYELNASGYFTDVYKDITKPCNMFSPFKTANSLLYTLGSIYKKESDLDDCFICNEKGNIIESLSSNIFLVINNKLITPNIEEGCIDGIIRNKVIDFADQFNIECIEKPIIENDFYSADEIFLTNSINGIRWVVAYKEKRYFKRYSNFFINKLNELFF